MNKPTQNNSGFTIIELMIATSVLSIILLLVTTVILNIGFLFSKGVNQTHTQDNLRAVADEISQQLRYTTSGGYLKNTQTYNMVVGSQLITYNVDSYCINGARYSVLVGHQLGTPFTPLDAGGIFRVAHALWRDTYSGGGCPVLDIGPSGSPGNNGTELIASNARLTEFSITPNITPNLTSYTLQIGIAYGDSDLLSSPSGPSVTCNGNAGDQFCSTAYLTTSVVQRLN